MIYFINYKKELYMITKKLLVFIESLRNDENANTIDVIVEAVDYIFQFRDLDDPNPYAKTPAYQLEAPIFNHDTSITPQYAKLHPLEQIIMDRLKKKFKCSSEEILIDYSGNHITMTMHDYLSYMDSLKANEWKPTGYYDDEWNMFYGAVSPEHRNDKDTDINNRVRKHKNNQHKSYD